ncbi:CopG family transcriptional regulator protein [Halorhabdus tiamatea SARL4B]|uniref:CopG family transcriptional regulator protein n=1 Tax=Halorhabdus tiamatea SARL4B TaxID=1033806 RepID=S6CU67_9EURY|nr:hypothetical protein [Halorhabdus tiamatea]ERJ07299.1 CopG family transcriptional regulator protein [Halorhabdus tiamatea SARL4B]CCQ34209.1 conserved hypothetical protein [Halorhabdus tiamatea SARL4B]
MASESTDSPETAVWLPPELGEWLEEHAAELDVERDVLVAQLLATYRTTATHEGDIDPDSLAATDRERIESIVREVLDDHDLTAPDEAIEAIAERIDDVEDSFQTKLEDVRSRVVQVKREADAKADADHDHDAFDRLDTIEDRIDSLTADIADLSADVDSRATQSTVAELADDVDAHADSLTAQDDRLEDVEDKLQTVAWAISDLRDAQASNETETVDRIKAAAARHDVSRAVCESCGEGVEIALMTRAACPHCEAAVTTVEPSSGFFGKPRLVAATPIEGTVDGESGDDIEAPDRRSDQP